jgi:hypothetical protein
MDKEENDIILLNVDYRLPGKYIRSQNNLLREDSAHRRIWLVWNV